MAEPTRQTAARPAASRAGSSMSKVGGCWQSRYFKVSIGCFPACPTALSRQTGASVGVPPCSAASRGVQILLVSIVWRRLGVQLQVCRSAGRLQLEATRNKNNNWNREAVSQLLLSREETVAGNRDRNSATTAARAWLPSKEPLFRAGRIIRAEPAVLAHSPPLQLQEPGSRPPALPQPDCSNSLAPNVNLAMLPGGTASTGPPTKSNRPREPWVNVSPVRILPTSDVGLSVAGFDPARREYAAPVRHWRSASCRSPGRWPARHKIRCIHPVEYIHT